VKLQTLLTGVTFLTLIGIMLTYTGCKKDDDIPLSEIPVITGVTPNEGTVGTELTITGSNFMANAEVIIGDIASIQGDVSSSTVIYAKVPSGIPANTLLPVTVKNTSGGEATLNNAFMAIGPLLSFVNSATKPSGDVGGTVILEGKAFGDIQGQGEVLFSDGAGGTITAAIMSDEDWTDAFIVTTVPNGVNDGPVVVKTETETSNEIIFKVTEAATFSPSTINWTLTSSLPVAVSGHKPLSLTIDDALNTTKQYVLVSGGRDGDGKALNQVIVGLINADGTISSWTSTNSISEAKVGAPGTKLDKVLFY